MGAGGEEDSTAASEIGVVVLSSGDCRDWSGSSLQLFKGVALCTVSLELVSSGTSFVLATRGALAYEYSVSVLRSLELSCSCRPSPVKPES